jgi:hypothetical protein
LIFPSLVTLFNFVELFSTIFNYYGAEKEPKAEPSQPSRRGNGMVSPSRRRGTRKRSRTESLPQCPTEVSDPFPDHNDNNTQHPTPPVQSSNDSNPPSKQLGESINLEHSQSQHNLQVSYTDAIANQVPA